MRNQIIAAAIEEINEFGIKFTMSDLVKRLAISKSTLYSRFPSKKELIGAIVDLLLENVQQQRKEILNNNALNTLDKVKALLAIHPPVPISNRFIADLKRYFPEEWEKGQQNRVEVWKQIETLITQGIEEGYFRSIDSNILKIIYTATVTQLLDYKNLVQNTVSINEAAEKMVDILFNGIAKRSYCERSYSRDKG